MNELTSSGKPVRALVRNPAKARKVFANPDGVELVEGSVEDIRALEKAFDGVELFHNCVNAPYPQWSTLPEIHGRITQAAGKAKARMVFPGNVYVYGHTGLRTSAKIIQEIPVPGKDEYGFSLKRGLCDFHGRARSHA